MIKVYDLNKKEYFNEKVAGENSLKFLYGNKGGDLLLNALVKRHVFSSLSGIFCDMGISAKLIPSFVKEHNINLHEAVRNIEEFTSFNDFFTRKLKRDARPIDASENVMVSPGDGRLLIKEVKAEDRIEVKGKTYYMKDLMMGRIYTHLITLRLNPTDYHRFHYPLSGIRKKIQLVKGDYYSVNPIALKTMPEIFFLNKKKYTFIKNSLIGDYLFIAVGATNVGSIVFHDEKSILEVNKGEEAGLFKFGGSTILVFINGKNLKFHEEILKQSSMNIETRVLMGQSIARIN